MAKRRNQQSTRNSPFGARPVSVVIPVLTESARFLGNRPQATRIKGAADVREERDRLVRDNYYLRMNQAKSGESVKQLEERIQQLERLLKQGQGGAAEDPAARKK